jgi:stearoyl-CoA desaturase (delta-9 desaturase)
MKANNQQSPRLPGAPALAPEAKAPISWGNLGSLAAVHLVGIGGTALYLSLHGLSMAVLIIALVWTHLTILAISGGYHRLFSHRTYEPHPVLEFLLLCFGAASFQNSAMTWAADHRRHHKFVDTDRDPYNARGGFWHSHIGWVLRKTKPATELYPVPDLARRPLVRWQHKYHVLIGVITGGLVPMLLGWAFGDPWGGLVVGGVGRLVLTYHATFAINSFAHLLGSQPYSDSNSARDSTVTALISMGEGYHNFHHTFPTDYRNGILPYQFDPTKWTLSVLSAVGLARKLRRTPLPLIERARLLTEERRLAARGLVPCTSDRAQWLRRMIDEKLAQWHALVARYESMRHEKRRQARETLRELAQQIRILRREFNAIRAEWRQVLRLPAPVAGLGPAGT